MRKSDDSVSLTGRVNRVGELELDRRDELSERTRWHKRPKPAQNKGERKRASTNEPPRAKRASTSERPRAKRASEQSEQSEHKRAPNKSERKRATLEASATTLGAQATTLRAIARHILPLLLLLSLLLPLPLLSQGLIIPEPPLPPVLVGRAHLQANSLWVDVQVVGMQAVTHLKQEFENPTDRPVEGYYVLPLPEGSPITDFSMKINGQKVKGELLDAKKARQLYEDILRKYRDPALLEYLGRGLLKLSIFPIPPRGRQLIEITYAREMLPSQSGMMEYRLPLSSQPAAHLKELVIGVNVETQRDIRSIYSPTHPLEVKRENSRHYKGSLEMEDVGLHGPFVFYVFLGKGALDAQLLSWKKTGEDGFFLLSLDPASENIPLAPKDVVFVLDASGSMRGEKMEQARRGLQLCIEQLQPKDRFEIVRFSTEAESLFGETVPADGAHLAKAKDYIAALEPIGGTNMEEALQRALHLAKASADAKRPLYVVLITDGKPTIGETDDQALVDKLLKTNDLHTRIFTIGVGSELNARLLDRLTEKTRGFRTYVYEGEKLDVKLADFMQKVAAPVLTDLSLEMRGGVKFHELYPKALPDLFRGSSLILLGRYAGHGKATLLLHGKRSGKEHTYEFELNFPAEEQRYEFIPSLWAARAVGYLLEQIRLHGEDEELIGEVVRLSKRYGIITPYTSYLILEDEIERDLSIEDPRLRHRGLMQQQLEKAEDYSPKKEAEEYRYRMQQSSGSGSVEASDELQELHQADNLVQAYVGRERLNYQSASGTFNLADAFIRVQGRAFYRIGEWWVDALALEEEWAGKKPKKVFLYSREFLQLVDSHPEYAPLWALNANVRLVLDGQLLEVEHPYE